MAERLLWRSEAAPHFALEGELDRETLLSIWPQREKLLPAGESVLDLSRLSRIDSAGLAFLMTLLVDAERRGSQCRLVQVPLAMQTLISLSNLTEIMAPYMPSGTN